MSLILATCVVVVFSGLIHVRVVKHFACVLEKGKIPARPYCFLDFIVAAMYLSPSGAH